MNRERIVLNLEDFGQLVRGKVVTVTGTETKIILADISFKRMLLEIDNAVLEIQVNHAKIAKGASNEHN